MKHVSTDECIALLLGLLKDRKKTIIKEHIRICRDCSALYARLKPSFIPDPDCTSLQFNTDLLKKRILYSAAELREKNSDVKADIRRKTYRFATLIAAGSLAVFLLITVAAFFTGTNNAVEFLVARIYGKADINAIPARICDAVSQGNTISTEENSSMMLWFSREYRMILMGKSQLTIDSAKLKDNNKIEVKYTLRQGTLLNRHKHEDTNISYAFVTPHALINADDADVMIHASNQESNILLIKGRLEVQKRNSAEKTTIDSPGRYVISDMEKIRPAEQYTHDFQAIDEVFNLRDDDEALLSYSHFYPTVSESAKDKNKEDLMDEIKGILTGYTYQSRDDYIN